MRSFAPVATIALLAASATLAAAQQAPKTGPIIESAGAVFAVPSPGFATRPDQDYKVAFEVAVASADPGRLNQSFPTDGLIDGVHVALSAMTAFLVLQEDGYRVNPW